MSNYDKRILPSRCYVLLVGPSLASLAILAKLDEGRLWERSRKLFRNAEKSTKKGTNRACVTHPSPRKGTPAWATASAHSSIAATAPSIFSICAAGCLVPPLALPARSKFETPLSRISKKHIVGKMNGKCTSTQRPTL